MLIVAVAAAGALLLWLGVTQAAKPSFAVDDKAGAVSSLSPEDLQAELQKGVDESTFSFRINSVPEFDDGQSQGNLMIENPTYNTYLMKVQITLNDTGQTVYETDLLKPGTAIALDSLDVPLEKGEYPATAMITAYDADTNGEIGKTAAGLTITIKN